jgi:ribonuclease R
LIVHRLLRELIQSGVNTEGAAILSDSPQPWQEKPAVKGRGEKHERPALEGPIPETELSAIATESSQSERRADDAERELIEWKKIKFMQDRVGEDFNAIILSCTKYGFFVELDDLFIEGLVPLTSLQDDRYMFRDTDRQIVGTRNERVFKMGQRVHVLLDRIDRQQRRLQFALLPSEEDLANTPRSLRRSGSKNQRMSATSTGGRQHSSPNRSGKKGKTESRAREHNKKSKGKRR